MDKRFWLLQSVGWLAFTLLQLAAEPTDAPVAGISGVALALALSALGVIGSLGLRMAYRRAQTARMSEFRMLALVAVCSLATAVLVDFCFRSGLWALSFVDPSFATLHGNQPLLARVPLLLIAYFLWSLLYVALSRQQSLRRATIAQSELLLALKDAQLQALLGHLGPHFMFNAINNIRALVLKDADAARTMLGKFASTLRYQFNQYDSPLVSVAEEMAIVRDYVDLLRLQLGTRLQYSEQIEAATLSMQVPRHSLQLLVENGIKHGLGLTPAPGELRVEVRRVGSCLQLDVRNTGTLRERALSTGTGLNNLEQRLKLGFGSAGRFELRQDGEYVLASLRLEGTT
ncbi:MAG: histidine kinase [Gammaproteobacteria bacterium]|nr:histidine kinase [Gammaproteobacteria bacterium]